MDSSSAVERYSMAIVGRDAQERAGRTLREDGGLATSKLLKDLSGTGETVTRLANAAVDDDLGDLDVLHGVLRLRRLQIGSSKHSKGRAEVREGRRVGPDRAYRQVAAQTKAVHSGPINRCLGSAAQ